MAICDIYLQQISDNYDTAELARDWGYTYRSWLVSHLTWSSFNTTYRTNVAYSISWLYASVRYLIWCNQNYLNPKRLPYYLANCIGDDGITMDDILTEMMGASFEQLTKFMGITQAYKTAVWDAPFNEEFYAALARGFKTWGV